MEVYLDLVMLLNFLVDFLLLLGTNRLSGFPMSPGRCCIAAGLGAVYSGACVVPGFHFLGGTLWRLVSLGLMAAIAFGWDKSALRRGGVFILLSMALGGMALSFGRGDFAAICLGAGLIWLLCRASFGEKIGGREYVPLELSYQGRTAALIALRDTGNTLKDPVTGEPVLVISGAAAQRLTGLTREQLRTPLETLARRPIPGLRLIPYRAVGQGGSMLLAVKLQAKLDGKQQSAIAAFAPEGLGGGVYQALSY
ncbi:MAG: sigma-E processing peptidase SpoIIGA [Eubacteriales bacterium]|nr:sigma-E processing peptidase SpoIIGA [Eubacteriales bacterium]